MIVSDAAVKNRLSVVVFCIIIAIIGTASYIALPRESSPDITIPHVFVQTTYRGVSASDIETGITINIEKKLKGLDRVKKIKSVSAEGMSQIDIEFIPGTNIEDVLPRVKDKVDEARPDLPNDLENEPSVFEVNFSEMPIIVFSLSGPSGPRVLREIADDLKDDIEAIPGVLEAEVTGGHEREIRIEVDTDKLAYYRIPITAFQQVVPSENQNTSGGALTLGQGRFQLRVPGEFETPDEILGLIVATHDGRPVYLKDVAKVLDSVKDETSRSRLDGMDAVNISVKKRIGENIIAITENIEQTIARVAQGWPAGTRITKLMDRSKEIRNMVADLENNIISGLLLVMVVLLFSLGLRNAVMVCLAIPFSMLISFATLHAMGITLNMVVLFSLTLALGMLVDNAIVIVENIYRYMEQGVPRIPAAMRATSEVAWPVIGSTLTTVAAFFPMIFWPGLMGEFMKFLPITLVVTLSASLLVALVINPALCAIFMRLKDGGPVPAAHADGAESVAVGGEQPIRIQGRILTHYARVLRFCLAHKPLVLVTSFALLIIMGQVWLLSVGLERPVEFFPAVDPKNVYINIDPPEGADLDYVDSVLRWAELAVLGIEDVYAVDGYAAAYRPQQHTKADGTAFEGPGDLNNVEHVYTRAVQGGSGFSFDSNLPNHIGVQFVDFHERRKPTAIDIETLRQRMSAIPGGRITVDEQEEGPPTGAPINIEIAGEDFRILGALAEQVRAVVEKLPHVFDVRDDYVAGLPSVLVRIDRQRAALFGLTSGTIGAALKTAYNGLDITTYYEGDEDYDVTVTLNDADRRVTDVLHKLMIPTPAGPMLPLTTLARIEFGGSIGDIVRINHERVVTVKANVDEKRVPGAVARAHAEKMLAAFSLPPGYHVKFTGENEFQQESQEFLSWAFAISVLLIFLILVTLFNSIAQPLIILTSVLLSLGGAFLGLFVIQSPFGIIMSGVGIISLAGVVVNNAIVLIDYTNKLVTRGMPLADAVIAAGATRLRPVMLTAITTTLGLIPMVLGVSYDFHTWEISWVSESTQWWRSMSIVVIFGLLVSTVLTLVVVPVLYALTASLQERSAAIAARLRARLGRSSALIPGEGE
ncbi:MAG: acriflavin resistance protein [Desulfatitalea sp. BRH_c12]|nr:MAG: acriflavin resistance protein [Desulfatitalea sp. BRH_c12]